MRSHPAQPLRRDLWWSVILIAKRLRATRRSGFLFFPEGRRPRWEVEPSLMVKKDGLILEKNLRFKEALVVFRKKQRASNPLANPWVKAGSSPHKKPQLRCWRRPLMVRQPDSEAVWAPSRAVGTSPVPWGERLCKWAQWKFAFILPSAANLLHEKKGLGESGGAFFNGKEGRVDFRKNLRVREDWWIFEDLLRFKEVLLVFRRFKKLLLFFRMLRKYL